MIDSTQQELSRLQEENQLLRTLLNISELSHDFTLSIDELYEKLHAQLARIIDVSNFYIARIDHEKQLLNFVYAVDEFNFKYEPSEDFPLRKVSKGFTELAMASDVPVLLNRAEMEQMCDAGVIARKPHIAQSWLGVPLRYMEEVLGAIAVQSYSHDFTYQRKDAEILKFASQHVAAVIKRHELKEREIQHQEKLAYHASHDTLTGLVNRSRLHKKLGDAIAGYRKTGAEYAVLFIDLDGFKQINDQQGHAMGDDLLRFVAKELRNAVREGDVVARFGGDEFVIVLNRFADKNVAIEIAERILTTIEEPIPLAAGSAKIGASIGILFADTSYDSPEVVLHNADIAMYEAKKKGKHRFEMFGQ